MRAIHIVLGATLAVGLATVAYAEPEGPMQGKRQEMLKKFDTNGDGVLSDEERAAAREQHITKMIEEFDADSDGKLDRTELSASLKAMRERHGKQGPRGNMRQGAIEKFDADGDGKLSEEERAAAHKALGERRQECLKKFDADGDGALNEEERAAARKERGERHQGPGRQGRRGRGGSAEN